MYRNGLQLDKGFDDEGSARSCGRRLGVESHGDAATAGEARVAAPLPESNRSVPTDTMMDNSLRSQYYLHTDKPVKNPYVTRI
jgi:hypothetical protein